MCKCIGDHERSHELLMSSKFHAESVLVVGIEYDFIVMALVSSLMSIVVTLL